jgi:hypothetical protein
MEVKMQDECCKHMKPLFTYEGDIFTKLSDNKIKVFRNRGVFPNDVWILDFSGR